MNLMNLSLLFVGFGLTLCSDVFVRIYHYGDTTRSWESAQNYCREKFTDLATFTGHDDLSKLPQTIPDNELVWFGLIDEPGSWRRVFNNDSNSWRWSASDELVPGYQQWAAVQPDNRDSGENCVSAFRITGWGDTSCEKKKPFVCFDGSIGQKTFHFVGQFLTWMEGRDYCREYHTDLAMIENETENEAFRSLPITVPVWIGLYRVPWRWSDGSTSLFRNWRDTQPNNKDGTQHCAAVRTGLRWDDDDCGKEYQFVCHKDLKVTNIKIVKVKFQTRGDLSDPQSRSYLLQKLEDELKKSTASTKISLKWKIPPEKQETKDEEKEDCTKEFI